jgi:hypothetical protein
MSFFSTFKTIFANLNTKNKLILIGSLLALLTLGVYSYMDFFMSLKRQYVSEDKSILVTKKEIKNERKYDGKMAKIYNNYYMVDVYYVIGKDNETSADLSLYVEDTLYNRFAIDSTYKIKVLNGHIQKIYPITYTK